MYLSRLSWLLVTAAMLLVGGCDEKAVGTNSDASVAEPPQWAMFAATPQRNGRSAFEGPRQGSYRFVQLAEDGEVQNYVLVQSVGPTGVVYAVVRPPGSNGHLVALLPDGTEAWRYPATDTIPIYGSALHPEGTLSIAALQVEVLGEFRPPTSELFVSLGTDGTLRWTWQPDETYGIVPTDVVRSPIYDEFGTLYVTMALIPPHSGHRQRHLVAFSSAGDFLWQFDRDIGPSGVQPAVGPDGTVYVLVDRRWRDPEPDEGLYALYPDGGQRWFVPFSEIHWTNTLAVGDDGSVYLGGGSGAGPTVTAVSADGDPKWTYQFDGGRYWVVSTTIAISATGRVHFGAHSDLIHEEPRGAVFAVSSDGEFLWSVETAGGPCGGLAVDSTEAVYTMTRSQGLTPTILGFEPDGAARIEVELDDPDDWTCDFIGDEFFLSSVVLASGRMYVGSAHGRLHIIE